MKSIIFSIIAVLIAVSVVLLSGCSISFGGTTVYKFKGDETSYSIGDFSTAEAVRAVDIDWLRGDVIICPTDEKTFSVTEEASGDISEDYRLRYSFSDGVLSIRFCKNGFAVDNLLPRKTLKVNVPGGTGLDRMNVNCVSADVKLCRADIKTADIETVSGDVYTLELPDIYSSAPTPSAPHFEIYDANISTVSGNVSLDETVISDKRDIDTVSGKVTLMQIANLGDIEIETTSGDVTLAFADVNASEGKALNTDIKTVSGDVTLIQSAENGDIEIETTSGDVKITLPEEASATIDYDTVSGDFECLRELVVIKEHGKNGIYRIGDGVHHIEVKTTSGDLTVG